MSKASWDLQLAQCHFWPFYRSKQIINPAHIQGLEKQTLPLDSVSVAIGRVGPGDIFAKVYGHLELVFGTLMCTTWWWKTRAKGRKGGPFLLHRVRNTVEELGWCWNCLSSASKGLVCGGCMWGSLGNAIKLYLAFLVTTCGAWFTHTLSPFTLEIGIVLGKSFSINHLPREKSRPSLPIFTQLWICSMSEN